MPSYGGESDSGYGGAEGMGFGGYGGFSGGGLEGAPDVGTLGGTMADSFGETSTTMGEGLSPEQSAANVGVNANPYGYDFAAAGMEAPGAFNLGQLFGYESPQGLATTQGEFAGNEDSYGVSEFAQSPFAKTMRSVLGMTPFGTVANMGISAALGQPLGQIAANAVPGLPGVAARAGYAAANSSNPAASLGRSALGYGLGSLGSTAGYAMGGPVGGYIGGRLGGMAANAQGGPSNASTGGDGGGFDLGSTLQGLGGLYAGYRGMQQAGQLQQNAANTNQALQGQMSSLAGMYAPDSPYAKQLQQQLARKDAASGRLSQYGPRSVELQARLAGMAPQVANSMSGLAQAGGASNAQAQAANQAQQAAKAQMLNKLIGVGESSGFNEWAGEGLSSLFS